MVDETLFEQAKRLAQENPDTFSFAMLQRRLRVGTIRANQVIEKLIAENVIKAETRGAYRILEVI